MCPEIGGGTAVEMKANDLEHKVSTPSSDPRAGNRKFLPRNYHGCVTDFGNRLLMAK